MKWEPYICVCCLLIFYQQGCVGSPAFENIGMSRAKLAVQCNMQHKQLKQINVLWAMELRVIFVMTDWLLVIAQLVGIVA